MQHEPSTIFKNYCTLYSWLLLNGKKLVSKFSSFLQLVKFVVCIAEIAICPLLPCSVPNLQSNGEVLAVELNSSFKLAKAIVCNAEGAVCPPFPCAIAAALTLQRINQSALAFLLVRV